MYPPRFELRDFMSYLAPGGYYFLQLLLIVIFVFWLFFPETLESLKKTLETINTAGTATAILLTFGFLIVSVFCYFIGVVIRLSAVDEIDDYSIQNNIRVKLNSTKFKLIVCNVTKFIPRRMICKAPSSVTCKQVLEQMQEEGIDNKDFQGYIREEAAKGLKQFTKQLRTLDHSVTKPAELLKSLIHNHVKEWLWAVDKFPYPLWLFYKTYRRAGPQRQKEFERILWPVLLETMRGTVSSTTPDHTPFNRCKLFIKINSPELVSDIYDREALVRMMNGFHRGLSLGLALSLWMLFILIVMGVSIYFSPWQASLCNRPFLHECPHDFWRTFIVPILLCLFNGYFLNKIEENFHILRMSESELVFDSYLLAHSRQQSATHVGSNGETDSAI